MMGVMAVGRRQAPLPIDYYYYYHQLVEGFVPDTSSDPMTHHILHETPYPPIYHCEGKTRRQRPREDHHLVRITTYQQDE